MTALSALGILDPKQTALCMALAKKLDRPDHATIPLEPTRTRPLHQHEALLWGISTRMVQLHIPVPFEYSFLASTPAGSAEKYRQFLTLAVIVLFNSSIVIRMASSTKRWVAFIRSLALLLKLPRSM